jgi:hypothetical protein
MNKEQTATTEQAAEWLFQLFDAKAWLLTAKPVHHEQPDIEQEAVSFLLALAEREIDNWQGIGQAARETVVFLLTDFMLRLKHPASPQANQTWQVDRALSPAKKALAIIAAEIRRSRPQFSRPH